MLGNKFCGQACCMGMFSWKEGDTGVGRFSSINSNSGILIENPLTSKAGKKSNLIIVST
jgi:hypothetical protein